jgi:hypothetical protein
MFQVETYCFEMYAPLVAFQSRLAVTAITDRCQVHCMQKLLAAGVRKSSSRVQSRAATTAILLLLCYLCGGGTHHRGDAMTAADTMLLPLLLQVHQGDV